MSRKRGHGEGTIGQRKNGIWCAQLMVGYKVDGRPDRRTVYGKTRAECQRKLDELRRRSSAGSIGDAAKERDTVSVFLTSWLEGIKSSIRPKTHKRYGEIVRLHLIPSIGRHRLSALKPEQVQRMYSDRLASGSAPRTVHHCHAVLHRALELAVKWGYTQRNVCDVVDAPRVPRREIVPPSPAEISQLFGAAEESNDPLEALWVTAAHSGCRLGELLGLSWEDVDLEQGRLSVRRTLIGTRYGEATFGEPKSVQSRRTIALSHPCISALRRHRDRQMWERQQLGEAYGRYNLVFATPTGAARASSEVSRQFKSALARAGLPTHFRFHDLRHASATAMLAAGIHPKAASVRLGHSTIAITMDLYSHALKELDVDAAEKLGEIFGNAKKASVAI